MRWVWKSGLMFGCTTGATPLAGATPLVHHWLVQHQGDDGWCLSKRSQVFACTNLLTSPPHWFYRSTQYSIRNNEHRILNTEFWAQSTEFWILPWILDQLQLPSCTVFVCISKQEGYNYNTTLVMRIWSNSFVKNLVQSFDDLGLQKIL